MVYVTHDQVEAMTLADRIVVINRGSIEQVGTPMELYHSPVNQFVAGFIGSPKMNFLNAELLSASPGEAVVRVPDGTSIRVAADATALAPGAKLTLGFRPEHIRATADPGDNALRAHVQLAEHLGDIVYLHARPAGDTEGLIARAEPENPLDTGDTAWLGLDPRRCFLFDDRGKTLARIS
jgi:multiple sugar transport system ATP-binding protein